MSIRNLVNDALHQHLGYADNTVVDFIVSVAARSSSASALSAALVAQGLPSDAADSLALLLVPPKAKTAAPAPEKTNKYALLPMEEEEPLPNASSASSAKKRTRKKDMSDALQAQETDAERDRRERDEFAERMALKKMEASAKASEPHVPLAARKAMEEAAKRKQMNVQDEKMIQEAKIKARWAYLEKREREQLQALRDQLRDEKELFSGEKLTMAERRIYEMNEKILALAEQRVNRKVEDGGYQIPDAYEDETGHRNKKKVENVLLKRYVEEGGKDGDGKDGKDVFKKEQEEWEETLINAAARQQLQPNQAPKKDEYELLLDEEQIQFVAAAAAMKGDLKKEDKQPQLSKAATMKEIRAALPIYPYRQGLLDAIKNYQVLIIVGETGSGKTTQVMQYLHEEGNRKREKNRFLF